LFVVLIGSISLGRHREDVRYARCRDPDPGRGRNRAGRAEDRGAIGPLRLSRGMVVRARGGSLHAEACANPVSHAARPSAG